MKKALLIGFLGTAMAVTTSYAQGTVQFGNYYSSTAPTINYGTHAPVSLVGKAIGGSFAAELAWFNGITADPSQLTALPGTIVGFGSVQGPAYPNSTPDGAPGAGWWGPNLITLSGTAANQVVTLEVLVFNGTGFNSGFTTLEARSALFQYTLGGGIISPPSFNGLMPNFVVDGIPEPSVFALFGLSAAGFAFFRSKKN